MENIIVFLFWILVSFLCGSILLAWVQQKKLLNWIDLVISFIIGNTVLTVLIFVTSFILGSISEIITSITFALIGSISLFLIYLKNIKFNKNLYLSKRIIFFTAFIFWAVFLWLIFKDLLYFEPEGNLMAGWRTVWGDWAAHMTYASSFSYADNFPPQLPIFAGLPFSYPFLADFLSAIFIKLGAGLVPSFIIPGFLFTLSSVILLMYLVWQITKQKLATLLTPLLYFFNGGLGFWYLLQDPKISAEATHIPSQNIHWISVITSQFIPQRGFTMAFPLMLVILVLFYQIYQKPQNRFFILSGFLISLLPLIHAHSYLTALFLAAFLFLKTFRHLKAWFTFSIFQLLLAFPAIWFFYIGTTNNTKLLTWHPGWMAGKENLLFFWLKNFGVMIFIPILGWFIAPKKIKLITLPFGLFFVLAHLFLFQPWDWDNTKVLTYWYIGASFQAAIFIEKLVTKGNCCRKILAIVILFLAIFSGFHDAVRILYTSQNKLRLFSASQIETAEFIRNSTSKQAIFLTGDNHDNFVPSLTGRKIFFGYPGWLWSYGINYYPRQQIVDQIKTGTENAKELIKENEIGYVVIGPVEKYQKFNIDFFTKNFSKVYENEEYSIFKIN